jgi:hypothetical protein
MVVKQNWKHGYIVIYDWKCQLIYNYRDVLQVTVRVEISCLKLLIENAILLLLKLAKICSRVRLRVLHLCLGYLFSNYCTLQTKLKCALCKFKLSPTLVRISCQVN